MGTAFDTITEEACTTAVEKQCQTTVKSVCQTTSVHTQTALVGHAVGGGVVGQVVGGPAGVAGAAGLVGAVGAVGAAPGIGGAARAVDAAEYGPAGHKIWKRSPVSRQIPK